MNYQNWLKSVPSAITDDPLWKTEVYRIVLFLGDIVWHDVTSLFRDKRAISLSDQLYRASGSISANVAEGYSMGTGKNRTRYYEYALGSCRETRDWFFKARHLLGEEVTQHRLNLLASISRLLLTMIPQQRGQSIREPSTLYMTNQLENLLQNIPSAI